MTRYDKWNFLAAALYLISIAVLIFVSFDFDGRTNMTAWAILALLTLPWSIVSVFFLWAISHGAGLEFFAAMYFLFGLINSFLLYKLFGSVNWRKDLGLKDKR